ncbi:MAG: lipocalin, partial [Chitinophagia bacterium]|nr:lipocalin [Chitinophagia bacterium]
MNKPNIYFLVGLTAAAVIAFRLSSCVSIPKGAQAVQPFDKNKYLGTWYEIARFDFRFEKDLNNVTATYTLRDDGAIRVDNKGYDTTTHQWKQSIGKALPAGKPGEARLKVSFFGPFFAGYNVIALDPDYKYALVAGDNLNYLWLLSREKTMPAAVRDRYLAQAQALGYN